VFASSWLLVKGIDARQRMLGGVAGRVNAGAAFDTESGAAPDFASPRSKEPVMRNRPTPTATDVQKMAAACQSEATKNKRLKERPALTKFQGGVPVMDQNECVGAIGVSGVQSHEDEQIANAGAAALT
jgi:uncharacterized protein GlcG (DUF336 family)